MEHQRIVMTIPRLLEEKEVRYHRAVLTLHLVQVLGHLGKGTMNNGILGHPMYLMERMMFHDLSPKAPPKCKPMPKPKQPAQPKEWFVTLPPEGVTTIGCNGMDYLGKPIIFNLWTYRSSTTAYATAPFAGPRTARARKRLETVCEKAHVLCRGDFGWKL